MIAPGPAALGCACPTWAIHPPGKFSPKAPACTGSACPVFAVFPPTAKCFRKHLHTRPLRRLFFSFSFSPDLNVALGHAPHVVCALLFASSCFPSTNHRLGVLLVSSPWRSGSSARCVLLRQLRTRRPRRRTNDDQDDDTAPTPHAFLPSRCVDSDHELFHCVWCKSAFSNLLRALASLNDVTCMRWVKSGLGPEGIILRRGGGYTDSAVRRAGDKAFGICLSRCWIRMAPRTPHDSPRLCASISSSLQGCSADANHETSDGCLDTELPPPPALERLAGSPLSRPRSSLAS